MKLLVFAHTPPPYHGQSYMVKQMLDTLSAGSPGILVYHVDAKFSTDAEDVGAFRGRKVFSLLGYCARALLLRARGADVLYYVPAPPKRVALYRDWLVMLLCRPFFRRLILHWHAAGLGQWVNDDAHPIERVISKKLLGAADLSISLTHASARDAAMLNPRKAIIVSNGIPDPCTDFVVSLEPQRECRLKLRRSFLEAEAPAHSAESPDAGFFTVVFVGTCSATKGLFATLEAVELANRALLARGTRLRVRLRVAGEFVSAAERTLFAQQADRMNASIEIVEYLGFVADQAKDILFRTSDCLSFPSLYPAESQPIAIIEALAYGLAIVATRWRGIPELLADTRSVLIEGQDSGELANAFLSLLDSDVDVSGRARFLDRYELSRFGRAMTDAFLQDGAAS